MLKNLQDVYIIDEELRLECIAQPQTDAQMVALLDDQDTVRHLHSYPNPITLQFVRERRQAWIERERHHLGFTRGIYLTVSNDNGALLLVGFAGISNIDSVHKRGDLGIVINARYHRRAIASRVLRFLVERVAFGPLMSLHRLRLETSEGNEAMRAWADRHMTFEGTRRECAFVGGQWTGICSYSLLRGEQCLRLTELGRPKALICRLLPCTARGHAQCYKRLYDLLYRVVYTEEELSNFRKQAMKRDDASALFFWGLLTFFGVGGVPGPHWEEARTCFDAAADMGDVYSIYFKGRTTEDDAEQRLELFSRAAHYGCPFAAYYAGQELVNRNRIAESLVYFEQGGVELDFSRRRYEELLQRVEAEAAEK